MKITKTVDFLTFEIGENIQGVYLKMFVFYSGKEGLTSQTLHESVSAAKMKALRLEKKILGKKRKYFMWTKF